MFLGDRTVGDVGFDFDDGLRDRFTGKETLVVLCPGSSVLNYSRVERDISSQDLVISLNLAAALPFDIDICLTERFDTTPFGFAQKEILIERAKSQSTTVWVKNSWMGANRFVLLKSDSKGLEKVLFFVRDLPLYGLKLLPRYIHRSVFSAPRNQPLNWVSSLLYLIDLARLNGVSKIHVYGADGGGEYFWETEECDMLNLYAKESLSPIASKATVHEVNTKYSFNEILSDYLRVYDDLDVVFL